MSSMRSWQPVADGEEGELLIGGPGVGAGYWNDPQSDEAQIYQRHPSRPDERMYRSGDLVRRQW